MKHRGSGDGGRKIVSGGGGDGGRNRGGGCSGGDIGNGAGRQRWQWRGQAIVAADGNRGSGGGRQQSTKSGCDSGGRNGDRAATEMVATETAATKTNIGFPVTHTLKSVPTYIAFYLCICNLLFVTQKKFHSEGLFVQQIEIYKHTNEILVIF